VAESAACMAVAAQTTRPAGRLCCVATSANGWTSSTCAADGTLRIADSEGPRTDGAVPPPSDALPAPTRTSVEVLGPASWTCWPRLRLRVAVPLVATRNAAPTQRTQEDRAMVLLAARRCATPPAA
jgi:hypothetical protein